MPADPSAPPAARRVKSVACPTCGTTVKWHGESRFRPFCSERCRLIDLGGWAAEAYRVPETVRPMDESGDC
jgi:uncharacterized protein